MAAYALDYKKKQLAELIGQEMVEKHGSVFLKLNNSTDEKIYKEASSIIRQELVNADVDQDTQEYVIAQLIGLGVVDILLKDSTISEIMINAPDQIYIDRFGQIII